MGGDVVDPSPPHPHCLSIPGLTPPSPSLGGGLLKGPLPRQEADTLLRWVGGREGGGGTAFLGLTLETLPLHTAGITCFASYAPSGDFCIKTPASVQPRAHFPRAMGEAELDKEPLDSEGWGWGTPEGCAPVGERLHGEGSIAAGILVTG